MSPFTRVDCYINEPLQQEATEQTTSITIKNDRKIC
mgnify:CR=1 FL=1